jgi:hypothetical protein
MELFLLVCAGVFFVAGSLLLLSPGLVTGIADTINKVIFTLDDKIPLLRKPLAIIFMVAAIYLWYILWYKIYT